LLGVPPVSPLLPIDQLPLSPIDQLPLSRRAALQVIAGGVASLAAGCKEPDEKIVAQDTVTELPYVHLPEGLLPGIAKHYATTLPLGGYGRGAIVTAFDGRPTKVEGNPRHPASLGGTDVFAQAEILGLYDPDRSQTISLAGQIADWPAFETAFRAQMDEHAADKGAGLRLLSGAVTSPTLLDQISAMKGRFPDLRWHKFEPAEVHDVETARAVYGERLRLRPRFADARTVVAFDADPLGPGPEQVANARAISDRRGEVADPMRLYSAECAMTLTGAFADQRIATHPDAIEAMIATLATRLGAPLSTPHLQGEEARFLDKVAKALQARMGESLVLTGPSLSPGARALAIWINDRLAAPVDAFALSPPASEAGTLSELATDLQAGKVRTLIVLNSNPVATEPGDLDFAALMTRASFRLHLGTYFDETAEASTWHLPAPHALESWSDIAAPDGTISLIQPLIRPLYPSCSAHRLLALMSQEADRSDYDRLRDFWRGRWGDEDFEDRWRKTLVDGMVEGSRPQPVPKPVAKLPDWTPPTRQEGYAVVFRPDPSVYDGRFANNAWLQECPQPFTKAVWGNAIEMSPEDAARTKIGQGDRVVIVAGGRTLSGPMRLSNGLAPGVLGLSLGYGRTRAGAIGDGVGFNAFVLQTSVSSWITRGATLNRSGRDGNLPPSTAGLFALPGEAQKLAPVLRSGETIPSPAAKPSFNTPPPPLAGDDPYAWAMVIDTGACIGCNACIVACQSENNIPSIGPDEIRAGRIMHWLRIDSYEHALAPNPRPVFQPVPCMHCEAAPCEPVCPVEASVHDHEGLNVQVYNRCVGTRFCQSNCPYKVRRFNFFGYADGQEFRNLGDPLVKAANNPDVTVRARGVMEKCTYCVQRISGARRLAERESRLIEDGEIVTACQAACPTQAIRFGNLADSNSAVSRLRLDPRHYTLLEELHTRPRTTYLARVVQSDSASKT
jgi:Fe-S-cluster-containing dehydrogenase component